MGEKGNDRRGEGRKGGKGKRRTDWDGMDSTVYEEREEDLYIYINIQREREREKERGTREKNNDEKSGGVLLGV